MENVISSQSSRQEPTHYLRTPLRYAQAFAPGTLPAEQNDRLAGCLQFFSQKRDQRVIGTSIYRGCRQPQLQGITMFTYDLSALGTWLDMQGDDAAIIVGKQPNRHHNKISNICNNTMATSGDRSILPISGRKRCIGANTGRLICATGEASGE